MSKKHQTQQPEGHEIDAVTDIYNVVYELWKRAAPGLSEKELEWFKGGSDTAQVSLRHFAAILKAIGTNMLCEERMVLFNDSDFVSRMFFAFSDYARYLEAMVFVADFADGQLRYRQLMER